jgi:hypothetical protein
MRRAIFNWSRFAFLFPVGVLLASCTIVGGPAFGASVAEPGKGVGVATHRQASTIAIDKAGQPGAKLVSFCLTADDKILAGCAGSEGEIRVIDAAGKQLDRWSLPVTPEAIYSRADGAIFVAGDGQILKLSSTGKVELSKQSPQAIALNEHPEELRKEVIEQAKQRAEQYGKQAEMYDKMIERADKEMDSINKQLADLDKDAKEPKAEEEKGVPVKQEIGARRAAMQKQSLKQRLEMYKRQKEQYAKAKEQFAEIVGAVPPEQLTDKKIDEQVKASMKYKLKASSISALNDDVFIATHATLGYGFDVWKMNDKFENPAKIVTGLSGCCGQMDVKANKDGLFVAENSEHRVCRFDRDGKSIAKWGQSARTGLEGFGSCCNPMNVAFGPGEAIYTAEDDTGRIKRYSADGKLLGLVGAVELKPGCKNCSIAVSSDGSRVYMLDITRNLIVRLDARPAAEVAAEIEKVKNAPAGSNTSDGSTSGESILTGALKAILSPN